jgi:hypothetical protein
MNRAIHSRLDALERPASLPCMSREIAALTGDALDRCTHPIGRTLRDELIELNQLEANNAKS